MSATEPRYCPVSTLLPAFAALPSIRRRHGGRPGYRVVSGAAGDHWRDESCAPGRRCSPRHLRRPSRRSATNWRQRGNPAAATVCRRAGRCGCYCRCCQAPPGRDLASSDRPGRKRPTMPERAVTKAAPRRMPASVAPAATENNGPERSFRPPATAARLRVVESPLMRPIRRRRARIDTHTRARSPARTSATNSAGAS